MLQCASDLKYG